MLYSLLSVYMYMSHLILLMLQLILKLRKLNLRMINKPSRVTEVLGI